MIQFYRRDAIFLRADEIMQQLRKIKASAKKSKPIGECELNTICEILSSLSHQVRMFNSEASEQSAE